MKRLGVAVELWTDNARPLIRAGASLARSLNWRWVALVVYGTAHPLSSLSEEQRRLVNDNTNLITWLGGVPFFCDGDDVPATLLAAVKLAGVDILMVGKPQARGFASRMFGDHVSARLLHSATIPLLVAAYPQAV